MRVFGDRAPVPGSAYRNNRAVAERSAGSAQGAERQGDQDPLAVLHPDGAFEVQQALHPCQSSQSKRRMNLLNRVLSKEIDKTGRIGAMVVGTILVAASLYIYLNPALTAGNQAAPTTVSAALAPA